MCEVRCVLTAARNRQVRMTERLIVQPRRIDMRIERDKTLQFWFPSLERLASKEIDTEMGWRQNIMHHTMEQRRADLSASIATLDVATEGSGCGSQAEQVLAALIEVNEAAERILEGHRNYLGAFLITTD